MNEMRMKMLEIGAEVRLTFPSVLFPPSLITFKFEALVVSISKSTTVFLFGKYPTSGGYKTWRDKLIN